MFSPRRRPRRARPTALLTTTAMVTATLASGPAVGPAMAGELQAASTERPAVTSEAYAEVELQARTNLLVNDAGYNLPPGSSFSSVSPDLNNDGEVAFRVQLVPDSKDPSLHRPGVWVGGHGTGRLVHTGAPGMTIDNEPSINDTGNVAFTLAHGGVENSLYRWDAASGTTTGVSTAPVIPNSYRDPTIDDTGDIGFQANLGAGRAYAAYRGGTGVIYVGDQLAIPSSPYTYLYTPAYTNAGQFAAKVATSADLVTDIEVRLFSADGTSRLILANNAVDPASPYRAFNNSVAVNDDGAVAAVATRAADGRQVVVRSDGTTTTEIAEVDPAGTIRAIEYFTPSIDDSGRVAFRAVGADGQAIYVGDGTSLERVVGKGDVVQTDLGVAQIGQHNDSPVFGGGPTINDHGDVVFTAGVHPQGDNTVEWGSGVFLAYRGGDAPEEATLSGTVTDANDHEPVGGATVTVTAADDTVVGELTTDGGGAYTLDVTPGSYTVTAAAPAYETGTANAVVDEPGQSVTTDLALATAVIGADPAGLDFTGTGGLTADLTIGNTGTAALSWSASSDTGWLALGTSAGTVEPGASATVAVTVDPGDLEPGTHQGSIVITGNAARRPEVEIPVSLELTAGSDLQIAVNAGGERYVDGAGTVWEADRVHTDGGWGYVDAPKGRPSKASTTGKAIDGTTDDELYRSLRRGPVQYRFDDVPAGTYDVALHFAEFTPNMKPGRQHFDVTIGGEAALVDHDIAAGVGSLHADVQTVRITHPGGDLTVAFDDERPSNKPVVNALMISGVTGG